VTTETPSVPTREALLHALYEAADLEHNLMCTYLYAAFSLKDGEAEGLSADEAAIVARWRRAIVQVAIEEMSHLTAVWNISSALGGSPHFGRSNFPLDAGVLPAGMVVKLAPFGEAALQHFIHLERPENSAEPEGEGFAPERRFKRTTRAAQLTPMTGDYETVGAFYGTLGFDLSAFVAHHGEAVAFCGDPGLQLSPAEVALPGAKPVICSKTALHAYTSIVEQGEGAPLHSTGSHYQRFLSIREELCALRAQNPAFEPAFPAAQNPVLRPPPRPEGRVWIEHEEARSTVDLANASYALMVRLLAHSYVVPRPSPEKTLALDLALGLMRAITPVAERAARLPAGPSNPGVHAGMTFTALRDAAPLPPGPSARRFLRERLEQLSKAASALAKSGDDRMARADRIFGDLVKRAERGFDAATSQALRGAALASTPAPAPRAETPTKAAPPPTPTTSEGVDHIEGEGMTLLYEVKKCIHARFCVTGAPSVFLANVKGPWIRPDAVDVARLVEIAHACPSGAIRYRRKDGVPDETAPPVNLAAVREAGPYAFRGDLRIDGQSGIFRATLCRCGASKNKPYCDGSHHEVGFAASGEPPTGKADMLEVRDGPLAIDPQTDGPLQVRGNLEITSGTGRVVARLQQARLCRCGGSENKPFCDGTHARIGFRST
jgi:CDGSH-type Zn-finger protein/uncharacterized Fe-S cluster protein YjdI